MVFTFMTLPPSEVLCAAGEPDPVHYTIHGDAIRFRANATDDDIAVLDTHREVTTVAIGDGEGNGPEPWAIPIKITNQGFAHLANCKRLQTLELSFIQPLQVTDEGLKALEDLKELRVIQLGVTPFTGAGLSHLTGPNVEELWLDFNSHCDDAAMDSIANFTKLRVLRFHGAPITDTGIARIAGLSQLENLLLGKSRVGDNALKIIGSFAKLKTLDLQYTRVTDAGMEQLKTLTKLQWLCVKGTAVTRKGLANLTSLPELTSLYLDDTQAENLPPDLAAKRTGQAQPAKAPDISPPPGLKR